MSLIYEALEKARRQRRDDDQKGYYVPPPAGKPSPLELPPSHPGDVASIMKTLYGKLRPLLDSKPAIVIHFVAPTPGEGASTMAREFALTAARFGQRETLLVDGHQDNPANAALFNCPDDVGLVDSAHGRADYGTVLQPVVGCSLFVGRLFAARSAPAFEAETIRSLYAALRDRVALTVVDCPPIFAGNYFELAPEAVDGVILVVQAEKVRPAVVAHAKELVLQSGGPVLGAVLNKRRNHIPEFVYRVL
jgi:Mrp family chromosome partitioning ATPase